MSWTTVLSSIDAYASQSLTYTYSGEFSIAPWSQGGGLTPTSLSIITSTLETLYTSTIAAGLMEDAILNGHILVADATDAAQTGFAQSVDNLVAYNLTNIGNLYYFNDHGTLVQEIPALAYIHEIAHLAGLHDTSDKTEYELNQAGADHQGDTVAAVNNIAVQMGWDDHIQVSYSASLISSDTRFSLLAPNTNYTEGHDIDLARLGDNSANVLDHSTRTTSLRDLMFGFGGDDSISSGAGSDYVYGGAGEDIISGGTGDDHLFGEDDDDVISGGDGNDIIVGGAGIDVLNGNDGDDTFIVDPTTADTIDGGDDTDVVSFINFFGPIQFANVDQIDFDHVVPIVNFTNVELIEGTTFDDILLAQDGVNIRGAAGDDLLYGDARNLLLDTIGDASSLPFPYISPETADVLEGGDGNDFLDGGLGSDVLDGGDGYDTASYIHEDSGITLTNSGAGFSGPDASVVSVENVFATNFDDTVTTCATGGLIATFDGNDTITVSGVADAENGPFDLFLLAGEGADTFLFPSDSDAYQTMYVTIIDPDEDDQISLGGTDIFGIAGAADRSVSDSGEGWESKMWTIGEEYTNSEGEEHRYVASDTLSVEFSEEDRMLYVSYYHRDYEFIPYSLGVEPETTDTRGLSFTIYGFESGDFGLGGIGSGGDPFDLIAFLQGYGGSLEAASHYESILGV